MPTVAPVGLGAPTHTAAPRGTHPVHVFILEEEHVRVHAVLPELLHMLEPGAVAYCGDKGTGESQPRGIKHAQCGGLAPCLLEGSPLSPPGAVAQEGKNKLSAPGVVPQTSPF